MINYQFVVEALEWYEKQTFKQIEVPWLVSREAIDVTRPKSARPFETPLGCVVASGEQSFIQMMMDGKLKAGNYCCATPCFRDEPVVDDLHRTSFFKLELISAWPNQEQQALKDMIHCALCFHLNYLRARVLKTEEGYDIVCQGIELGSYGIRKHGNLRWVYGTGVALPRMSMAMKLNQDKIKEIRSKLKSKEGLNVPQSTDISG